MEEIFSLSYFLNGDQFSEDILRVKKNKNKTVDFKSELTIDVIF